MKNNVDVNKNTVSDDTTDTVTELLTLPDNGPTCYHQIIYQ